MKRTFGLFIATMRLILTGFFATTLSFAADVGKPPEKSLTGWPNWRGPDHNGMSTEKGWLTAWPKDGLKQLWSVELGSSYGSVSISDGKAYAMGSVSDKDEVVYCLDVETGKEVWRHVFPNMTKDTWPGPRSTPAVDGKFVYVITIKGEVCCLDALTGQVVWNKDMKTDFNLAMPHHLFSSSPITHGDLLLVNMGPAGVAFDKKTGNIVWNNIVPKSLSVYASPVPFMQGNKACVAFLSDMALTVVNEANGQTISTCACVSAHNENSPDPVVIGDKLFQTTFFACTLLKADTPTASPVKMGGPMRSRFATPVLVGDYLYCFNGCLDDLTNTWKNSGLICMDPKDCSIKWAQGGFSDGGLIAADGKLIILDRSGMLVLVDASPASYKELARVRAFPEPDKEGVKGLNRVYRRGNCFSMPVLCDGRIYVRNNTGVLACLDVRTK